MRESEWRVGGRGGVGLARHLVVIERDVVRAAAQHSLDLGPFETAEALEALGLDRLKSALMAAGLKCGGTLRDRAERLLSTRGKDRADWDPKILAKPKKKG